MRGVMTRFLYVAQKAQYFHSMNKIHNDNDYDNYDSVDDNYYDVDDRPVSYIAHRRNTLLYNLKFRYTNHVTAGKSCF